MSPLIIAALIAAALALGYVLAKVAARYKTPAAIAKVEATIEGDAWKLLSKTVAAVADASSKKSAVSNANADLAEHVANVAKLKAYVAALPDA